MIPIAAVQPLTLSDFPGRAAAIVFLAGCDWRCPYCHNRRLWSAAEALLPEDEVLERLAARRELASGVVVTGGEPTLHEELPAFLARLRAAGLAIKLDTNGGRPERLRTVLVERLADYIALDLKAAAAQYAAATGDRGDAAAVRRSLALLRAAGLPYEVRTTVCARLHDEASLLALLDELVPGERWWLQAARPVPDACVEPPPPALLARIRDLALARGIAAAVR